MLELMSISEKRLNWLRGKLIAEIGEKIQQQGAALDQLQM